MSDDNIGSEANKSMMGGKLPRNENKETLSDEQLSVKINALRNLCTANKITPNNAFDLDMTEYLHKWLKKKSQEGKFNQDDLFQDMSDYLDTTGKIYGCRIDSVNNSIHNLYEQVKIGGMTKNDTIDVGDSDEKPEFRNNKRTREMITTSDKLRGNPIDSFVKMDTPFDLMELTREGTPSKYFLSKFNNTTFIEEYRKDLENSKKVVKSGETFKMKNLTREMKKREICSEFSGFVAEHDKVQSKSENYNLDFIEERYFPDNVPLKTFTSNLMTKEDQEDHPNDNHNESDSNPVIMEQRVKQFSELVDCIDGSNNDYSFYNPTLLVNWSGPKAWKAQTLKKALKIRSRNEHAIECAAFPDNVDEDNEQIPLKIKPLKNQKNADKTFPVKWLEMKQITSILDPLMTGNQQCLSQTMDKWTCINNAADPPAFKISHKFTFLKRLEARPSWMVSEVEKTKEKSNENEISSDNDVQCEGDDGNADENDDENAVDDFKDNVNVYTLSSDEEEEEDDDDDVIIKETKVDVFLLKTEIIDIVNQESVESQPNGISFYDLLRKLETLEREIPMALIYVSILHLRNEKRLKISYPDGKDGDVANSYIVKI